MDRSGQFNTRVLDVAEPIPEAIIISSDSEGETSAMDEVKFHSSLSNNRKRSKKQKVGNNPKKMKINYECSICLDNIRANKIAKPSGCLHYFCVTCLQRWAKSKNSCPLDRIKFSHADILNKDTLDVISKMDKKGKIIKVEIVHRCQICMKDIKASQMAKPSGCNHYFCVPCLENWSETRNCCPVDEIKFSEADILDTRTLRIIKKANIRNVAKVKKTECSICNIERWQGTIVDCDRCLLKYHIGCLREPATVRVGRWLCHICEPLGFENINLQDAHSRIVQRYQAIAYYKNMQTDRNINLETVNHCITAVSYVAHGSCTAVSNPQAAFLVMNQRSKLNVAPRNTVDPYSLFLYRHIS